MATKQKFKEYRVLELPTSELKAGDRYYLNVGNNKYQTYTVSDSLQLVKEAGAEFIEKDTMADMRSLSSREIWALENNYFKGVKLNGYYTKNDTPASIIYYISSTSEIDDGGSVIEINTIKLHHKFEGDIDLKYFGIFGDNSNISSKIQKVINNSNIKNTQLLFSKGNYKIKNVLLKNNIHLKGIDSNITVLEEDGFKGDNIVNASIKGFIFNSENQSLGFKHIHIIDSDKIEINNNIIESGENGIHITQCSNIRVLDNNITNMRIWGIYIDGATDGVVSGNFSSGSQTADGIKIGGSTSPDAPIRKIKNLIVTNNICYNNFRDGIDCASNQFENVVIHDNTLSYNSVQGLEFKVLAQHTGYVKDSVIQDNTCIGNGGSGISAGVENPLSTTSLIIKGNTLIGLGFSNSATYAMSIQTRGNNGSRVIVTDNTIRDYYYGIRINNSSFIEIFDNNIYTRRFGIYLRNGLATDNISNIEIYKNRVKSFDHSAITVGLITDSSVIGTISNVIIESNEVSMVSYVQKPIFIQSGLLDIVSVNNRIALYLGTAALPSFPSNVGDLVMVKNPVERGFTHFIAIAPNDISTNNNNYKPYGVFGNATTSFKGLINQKSAIIDLPGNADNTAIINKINEMLSKDRNSGGLNS